MRFTFAGDLPRDLVIRRRVARHHLHVDGRRQAEIQNLVGDVGRLEEEHHVGELLVQALAQPVGVLRGGAVIFRFSEIRMSPSLDAERRAVAERQVEAAVGNPDVVDDVLDLRAAESPAGSRPRSPRRSARSSPGACPPERARAVASARNPRSGRSRARSAAPGQRPDHKQREARQHRRAMIQAPVQQRRVRRAHQLEAPVEDPVCTHQIIPLPPSACSPARVQLHLGAQHVVHHGRESAFARGNTTPSSRTPPPSPAA